MPLERGGELVVGLAQRDVASPAAVPRLEDERRRDRGKRPAAVDVPRDRMWEARPSEDSSGEQLVVGREERARAVEDRHTAGCENAERPEAVVDAVERRAHVEAPECRVGGASDDAASTGVIGTISSPGTLASASARVVGLGARETIAIRMRPLNPTGRFRRKGVHHPGTIALPRELRDNLSRNVSSAARSRIPPRDPSPTAARRLARGRLRPDVQRQERGDDPSTRRAEIAGQRVLLFKPRIDDRYDAADVVSHAGVRMSAVPVDGCAELVARARGCDVVGIDEVQFFEATIVDAALALADGGVRVIAAGLDQDFRRQPFGPMPELLAHAEFVDKLQAVCHRCGGPATTTQRLVDGQPAPYSGETIVVGALDSYEARCRDCHEAGADAVRRVA